MYKVFSSSTLDGSQQSDPQSRALAASEKDFGACQTKWCMYVCIYVAALYN
jgi:hypothetical protein